MAAVESKRAPPPPATAAAGAATAVPLVPTYDGAVPVYTINTSSFEVVAPQSFATAKDDCPGFVVTHAVDGDEARGAVGPALFQLRTVGLARSGAQGQNGAAADEDDCAQRGECDAADLHAVTASRAGRPSVSRRVVPG